MVANRRPPAPPPDLAGFEYEALIGSGGFSDVFRYTQQLPHRDVAIKVLLSDVSGEAARVAFVDEANLMAKLSAHPSIVSIYHADTASDGRPYLVMEYCSQPNLAHRMRHEFIDVAQALRIGIRLAGAVETAHRSGILHRDIKPANVLMTDYGWPALTDFGMSVLSRIVSTDEVGMSIPWAPPETFVEGAERAEAADIYSLAATIYGLLAGRSPFEADPGYNSALEFMGRIERDQLPSTGRADVPHSLEKALARAMAKRPSDRYRSAAAFGHALQTVEQELQLAQTSLDVPDISWARPKATEADHDDMATRARPIAGESEPVEQSELLTRAPIATTSDEGQESTDDPGAPARSRRWLALLASVSVVVVIVAIIVVGVLSRPDVVEPVPSSSPIAPATRSPEAEQSEYPAAPVDLAGERVSDTAVRFSWESPEWDGPVTYVWRIAGAEGSESPVEEALLELNDPGTVCIEVATRTELGRLSDYAQACVT